jgi:hypothetical protein
MAMIELDGVQAFLPGSAGQSHMEFAVVEGWLHLLEEWRYQLGSRVPERRGTRIGAFLCSEQEFFCGEPPTGFFICGCPVLGSVASFRGAADWVEWRALRRGDGEGMRSRKNPFKGCQFTAEVILWAVRWYLQFPISYRGLELMLRDRGVSVDHTIVYRWIQAYAVELEKRLWSHLRPTNGAWLSIKGVPFCLTSRPSRYLPGLYFAAINPSNAYDP